MSFGDGLIVESERFYPWTVKRERENLRLIFDEIISKREFDLIWIFGGGPSRLVFLRLSQRKKKRDNLKR